MNRANQQALFQQTNQAVLGIRQLEINYYTNLYGVFGTQAVLIGGFVYGTFTQNNTEENNWGENAFLYLYFVWSALTIASSVHIMLCTIILQVYGPGLALHGPLGSMAKAAEGLQAEQNQVMVSFIFMMVCFAFSTVWIFWTVMTFNEAVVCSFIFAFAARQWYYYAERIYLRFYWNKTETNWNNGDVDNDIEFDREPGADLPVPLQQPPKPQYKEKKLRFGFLRPFSKRADTEAQSIDPKAAAAAAEEASGAANVGTAITGDAKGVDLSGTSHTTLIAMEGYLTCRNRSEQQVVLDAKRWSRQYFVLFRTGEFYIYNSRQTFRTDPRTPLYLRPLRLIDYFVAIDNVDRDIRSEIEDDGRSVASTAVTVKATTNSSKAPEFRFQITLIPRENEESFDMGKVQLRNHWMLRCDTEEELDIWTSIIKEICPSCFRT